LPGLVKLKDTGEKVPQTNAFKAADGKYYSSEAAFEYLKKQNEFWICCNKKLFELLQYEKGMKFPTVICKKLKELESYGWDVVFECICDSEDAISWALNNKEFSSEYGKCAYIMAIVVNHINDTKKKVIMKERELECQKKIQIPKEIDIQKGVQKKCDISRFLEDGYEN
jgi:hypothetical protein